LSVAAITTAQVRQEIAVGDAAEASALIVGIDKQDRTLTLIGSEGNVTQFEAGNEVRNFDQIKVGDYVKVKYHESVAVYLGPSGTQPQADAGLVVARSPQGAMPAGSAIGAVDVSAKVEAIDRSERTVILEGYDGHSATVQVDPSIKAFDTLNVGDLIHARYTEAIAISVEKTMPDKADTGSAMTLLFVQNAEGFSYDKAGNTLTLEGVGPAVTYFADRPYRIAGHVLLPGFLQLWNEGSDSFKNDPPNATLSIFDGSDVNSAVIEIADPKFENNQLTYTVVRVLEGDLPASGGVSSLFIDGLFDGGALGGGLKGAAGGALIGAISGDAGKGAAIGAAVGIVGGAVKKSQKEKAAKEEQATTRVINVPNPNGSFTPVPMHLVQNGWQGPKGEIYPTLPTADQLQSMYGIK